MKFNLILSCFVAILALVNPIQKVLIVTSLQERFSPTELRYISIKSTITAMLILIFFLYLGQVTFSYVFRVELYSFQITCGAVLMYNGLSGLLKGFFMKVDEHIKIADLTTVPILPDLLRLLLQLLSLFSIAVLSRSLLFYWL